MLRLNISSVKEVERLASERSLDLVFSHCWMARRIPGRCIFVADETHIHGYAMVRPRGRSLDGQPLETLAPDRRSRQRLSSIVTISHNTGILELTVNEVPTAQCGDDWVSFFTSEAERMNGYVPGAWWEDQPLDCVLLYDSASVHNAVADEILTLSGPLLLHLPLHSPNWSSIEPTFAD